MRVLSTAVLSAVIAALFLTLPREVVAATPLCPAGRHLCYCRPVIGPQGILCCKNTLLTRWGMDYCVNLVEPLEPIPADARIPVCPRGYISPSMCSLQDPEFCCKPASALSDTCDGAGGGRTGASSCQEVKNRATSPSEKKYCESLLFEYKGGICERRFETTWEGVNTCDDGRKGVQTAIGCIPTGSLEGFVTFLLKYAFFASGGIILLMLIATGYTVITSQGNPEKLQAAKENVTSLFAGLILIAFSLVILQTIGADILGLPTF